MFIYIIIVLIGWIAGMLVNYLSDVLPLRRTLVPPFCLACDTNLSYINYLIWPRRCDVCGENRSMRTWIVEATFIVLTLLLWIYPPQQVGFVVGLILLVYFGVVFVIDLEHRLILQPVSVVGGVIAFFIGIWLHGLQETILGGLAGFGIMLGFYLLGYLFAKGMARRRNQELDEEALGFGDVMLGGVLGLLLGWPGIILGIILAILLGGLVSLIYVFILIIQGRYQSFIAIPYGPFLVIGSVGLLFFRDLIVANLIH